MTGFAPDLAEIRFGCGLSPVVAPPMSVAAMLEGLHAPDAMADRFPVDTYDGFRHWLTETRDLRKAAPGEKPSPEAVRAFRKARNDKQVEALRWAMAAQLRWTWTESAFRERLVAFWADHFTALGKMALLRAAAGPYVETAIRPHVAGRFADLLVAAETSPMMLHYLDQATSVGPASPAALKREARGGLNENLAREILELHTLGVGGPYSQDDVRQLAELLTGLTIDGKGAFAYRRALAEPGAETVLGQSYDGGLPAVKAALGDLAVHPATAAHLARKLAVHFVSDTPDEALVEAMAARFLESGGDLSVVYTAMLEHPAAWALPLVNVKPPQQFIGSAWRALAVQPETVAQMKPKEMRQGFEQPLVAMGQPWMLPNGPDGWPEQDSAWVTPPGVAARLIWAVNAPSSLVAELPDPRGFVDVALGRFGTDAVRFAAAAAESRPEAIGLVLASPAFQRR